jgi:cysteine desulfurase
MTPRVYLDNNATTPLLPEVLEAMLPFYGEHFGNASSIHHHGQETRGAIEHARESIAALLGCRASEIVFTSGGTEADNLAIFGLAQPGDHLITSTIEHHAVLNACKHLSKKGCDVTFVPVDSRGVVDPGEVQRAIRPNTKLISIMLANNETGVLQPVEEIGKIAEADDVYFHTDAVQAAGKIPIDVNKIGCDMLTISGHKIHAPQGVGALYIRKGTRLDPMIHGGSHERSRRAGTENVPGIVGLGKAAELASSRPQNGSDQWSDGRPRPSTPSPSSEHEDRNEDRSHDYPRVSSSPTSTSKMATLRDRLERELLNIEATGLNGEGAPRVPNTTNIYFDGIEGESLVIALDLKGLAVSTGAACSSGAIEPSHVLTAMALRSERAKASIRFSVGKQNSDEDVDFALSVIPDTVARLRKLSPVWSSAALGVGLGLPR